MFFRTIIAECKNKNSQLAQQLPLKTKLLGFYLFGNVHDR
jgi:hypothetical protein